MTARLRRLRPGDLTAEQTDVYQAIAGGPRRTGPFALTDEHGGLRGPFNAMLLSPPVGKALQAVGAAVRYQATLTDRVRELAILIVAWHWRSAFEIEAHEAVGRGCGVTEPELDALRAGTVPEVSDRVERVALRTTAALTTTGRLDDEDYAEAIDALGERGLFELTTLVGYYATLALQLNVFAGEDEAGQ
jgi:4-carboxymuconolactone decarboxylase